MAYLELSLEAYDDLIKAAGLKAGAVAKVCRTQGVWSIEAALEEPTDVEVEETETAQTNLTFETEPTPAEVPDEPESFVGGSISDMTNDPEGLLE